MASSTKFNVSPASGNAGTTEVKVSTQTANSTNKKVKGTMVITPSDGDPVSIALIQYGTPAVETSSSYLSLKASATSFQFRVLCDYPYEVILDDASGVVSSGVSGVQNATNDEWVSHTLTLNANTTSSARTFGVKLKFTNIAGTECYFPSASENALTATQRAQDPTWDLVSQTDATYEAQTVEGTITDLYNVGWSIFTSDEKVTYVTNKTDDTHTKITFSIPENTSVYTKGTTLKLMSSDGATQYASVTITQDTQYTSPTIAEDQVQADAAGGAYKINIADPNNAGWSIASLDENGIDESPIAMTFQLDSSSSASYTLSGTGSATVTVNVPKNAFNSDLNAVIQLTSENYGTQDYLKRVPVYQESSESGVTKPSFETADTTIPSTEKTLTIKVTDPDNVGWKLVNSTTGAVTLADFDTSASHTGDASIEATVSENQGSQTRTISLRLMSADGLKLYNTFIIYQMTQVKLTINDGDLTVDSGKQNIQALVEQPSELRGDLISDSDEVSITIAEGYSTDMAQVYYNITIPANTDSEERVITFKVVSDADETAVYAEATLTQRGSA